MSQTDDRKAHWQNVYVSKGELEVSWFESSPELSMKLIRDTGHRPEAAIVDVGGGASRLVDALIARGQVSVTVLDISATALDVARARLGERAAKANWLVTDVTRWTPESRFDVWHDRAALHFLTETANQRAYVGVMRSAISVGGVAIIGTFALDGPEKCSGLPVARHDAASLAELFGPEFTLVATRRHDHQTPWGSIQKFQFSTFRRIA